jgi:peptide deformylase
VAKEVHKKDLASRKLKTLITKMRKVLGAEEYGVAIAAPQVGSSLRLFVVAGRVFEEQDDAEENGLAEQGEENRGPFRKHHPADHVYINPEITRMSRKKEEMAEGCLSVRGRYGKVPRHQKVTLKALDEHGNPVLEHASGLLAQIFQHEVDHLNGILFVDKAIHTEDWEEFRKNHAQKKD